MINSLGSKMCAFKGADVKNGVVDNNISNTPYTDEFVVKLDKMRKQKQDGDLISRLFWSPAAIYTGFGIPIISKLIELAKVIKFNNAKNTLERNKYMYACNKRFPFLLLGGVAVTIGLQFLFKLGSDKRMEDIKNEFNNLNNTTSAKILDKSFNSSITMGAFDVFSGGISISNTMVNDPIRRHFKLNKVLRHENVHAKQTETIVRDDNGIEKLNYIFALKLVKDIQNESDIQEIKNIYTELMNDKTKKYDNVTVPLGEYEANFKQLVTAMYILKTNKNATMFNIPMIINEKHYNEVRNLKGKLTPDEKIKAQQYCDAYLNYPKADWKQTINPFSDYYSNILEKEAYKESPNLMTRIRSLFAKE